MLGSLVAPLALVGWLLLLRSDSGFGCAALGAAAVVLVIGAWRHGVDTGSADDER